MLPYRVGYRNDPINDPVKPELLCCSALESIDGKVEQKQPEQQAARDREQQALIVRH